MPDEEMGCGCGCQDCECKEINVCDTTERVHADLRDKLMVFADYVCTIALTPCSQLGKVMSKVVYYLWCMLKDLVNMIINNRKRTETLMENDEYFCDRMSDISNWTINLSNTQARNHQKITKFIDDMTSLGSKTKENGFLSEVAPQSLVLSGEPNATLTATGHSITQEQWEGLDRKQYPTYALDYTDPTGIPYNSAPIKTNETTNKLQHYLIKLGESVSGTYSNLQNSRLGDKKVKSVKYTITLTKLESNADYAVLTFFPDPTKTAFISAYDKDIPAKDVKLEYVFKARFYDEEGNEISPTLNNPSIVNLSSLNSKAGEGEYVADFSGKMIPITGSAISVENGVAMNYNSDSIEDIAAELGTVGNWDDPNGNPNAYVGAIAGVATQPIELTVGTNNNWALWFAFNSNVKAPVVEKPVLEPLPVLPYECNIKEFEC